MKDLSKLDNDSVLEYLEGKRITWISRISEREDSAIVLPTKGGLPEMKEDKDGGRAIHFLAPEGHRWVLIDRIKSVSRKKYGR